jgi:beta-galactosidase
MFKSKLLLWIGAAVLCGQAYAQSIRVEENFDAGWLFARYGLQPDGSRKPEPGRAVQTLNALAPYATSFNDSDWRKLNLPHDWGIEGPFRIDLDGYTGKLPWRGIGWYRKHFMVPAGDKGKQIYVDFDGAMANAEVWLNGHKAGEHPYGYTSFRVDLTPFVAWGKENIIAIRLNTEKLSSRWYPGAGIYRHVHLLKTHPVHVAQWGAFVTTPVIKDAYGDVQVALTLVNHSHKSATVDYSVEIFECGKNDLPTRKAGQSRKQSQVLAAGKTDSGLLYVKIPHPMLWDLEHPQLYLARVKLFEGQKNIDEYDAFFGFRTIEFTHNNGFLLNGKRVQLQGTCNHHDLGALGAAVNIYALQRQLTILKNMGCNALRTSHNPPAPELLTLADKMGFLVMDEAFDCFLHSKDKEGNDYARLFEQWHEKDLSAMVMRDRNHPSVILWSSGNEIPEQHEPSKFYLFDEMRNIIHRYDSTRPATCGISLPRETAFSGVEMNVDVHGMNYASGKAYGGADLYGRFLDFKGHEQLAGYGSETSSTMSSRGEYFPGPFQMPSYDLSEPGWGSLPDAEFAALDKYPAICGEFVWTGFDYLGEPTPFNSDASVLLNHTGLNKEELEKEKQKLEQIEKNRPPSRSSYFGIVDLVGFPKDRYYLYQARWRPDFPMVHILPHWNFPDRVGKTTPVFIYTSGDEAELFLNGRSLGRKKKQPYEYRLRWNDLVYEPGELKAVAYKNRKEWATSVVTTTAVPAKLQLTADKTSIKPDGTDLVFVTVAVTDKDGHIVPTAKDLIHCRLKGEGEIVATDNGDATCLIPFSNPVRPAFNGLMLIIIKAKQNAKRHLQLIVESNGLEKSSLNILVK